MSCTIRLVFNVLKREEVSKCWLAAEGFIAAVGGRAPFDKL